jgi:hypothetical protein
MPGGRPSDRASVASARLNGALLTRANLVAALELLHAHLADERGRAAPVLSPTHCAQMAAPW